jgi:predicted PP-loop superfamily ATPase
VAVAMSSGVDSTVSALLLKKAGQIADFSVNDEIILLW